MLLVHLHSIFLHVLFVNQEVQVKGLVKGLILIPLKLILTSRGKKKPQHLCLKSAIYFSLCSWASWIHYIWTLCSYNVPYSSVFKFRWTHLQSPFSDQSQQLSPRLLKKWLMRPLFHSSTTTGYHSYICFSSKSLPQTVETLNSLFFS